MSVPTRAKPKTSTHPADARDTKMAISLRIRPDLKAGIEELADRRGMPYQTLINLWLSERYAQEVHHMRPAELADLMRRTRELLAQLEQRIYPAAPPAGKSEHKRERTR